MSDIMVRDLTLDSRAVKPGDVFIATQGLTVDGRAYIAQAIQNGAVAVLAEKDVENRYNFKQFSVPVIEILDLNQYMGPIAAQFFENQKSPLTVIGITGTSGKTSVSHFVAQLLAYTHQKAGLLGTLGMGVFEKNKGFQSLAPLSDTLKTHDYTTPDAIGVQRALALFRASRVSPVVMEVTSHALHQHRVAGVVFQTTVFTNLSHEHLDYHLDMHQYGLSKQRLFTEFDSQNSVICLGDAFGLNLFRVLEKEKPLRNLIGYTLDAACAQNFDPQRIIVANAITLDESGMTANLKTPWGEGVLRSDLLGRFNLSNLLAALAVVCLEGVEFQTALQAISAIKTVPGRMMRLGIFKKTPSVVVDYAHKPEALKAVLSALRLHCRHKLWCIVGCGGDRDKTKRPIMAEIAESLSDYVCLTQDNPRTEDPIQIMNDMLKGFKNPEKVVVEFDRRTAILSTVQKAGVDDIVLIAGKGHEDYQIIGTEKKPFSDIEIATLALSKGNLS